MTMKTMTTIRRERRLIGKSTPTKSKSNQLPASLPVSLNYWENKENRISFINLLVKQLQIEDINEWYRVSFYQIGKVFSNEKKYNQQQRRQQYSSPSSTSPSSKSPSSTPSILSPPSISTSSTPSILSPSSISPSSISSTPSPSSSSSSSSSFKKLFELYPLHFLLQEFYPNHTWNISLLQNKRNGFSIKASQRWLRIKVQDLFPQSGKSPNILFFLRIKSFFCFFHSFFCVFFLPPLFFYFFLFLFLTFCHLLVPF
jgi:hypothetical protein